MKRFSAIRLARASVIAALYTGLTLLTAPISFGAIQFRIAECLCILAIFFPEAVAGLAVGCFFANIMGGMPDMLLGTAATFLAAFLTYACAKPLKNRWSKFTVCLLFQTTINALTVPLAILQGTNLKTGYVITALQVALGELGVFLTCGLLLYLLLPGRIGPHAKSVFKITNQTFDNTLGNYYNEKAPDEDTHA